MTETFARLVDDSVRFFSALKANNNRAWFQDHKSEYDTQIKRPAGLMADVVAARLEGSNGHPMRSKIFRQHRDIRFSKDKSPYNTHLHMLWTARDAKDDDPAYFLGISPEYVTAGAGVMMFGKERLLSFRDAIDGQIGDELSSIIGDHLESGCRIDEPALKRVPKPYDANHRHGLLLRRKGVVIWRDFGADQKSVFLEAVLDEFDQFKPLADLLSGI